ncbi:hydroxymethylglutaryl-CoA reductase [Colletotrichum tofieldiae]|uniref:Hydroxymethylglutaryl-CoA reductase n=1 Tax=Colletotrichum tofieldiae TaxID=708197 RepID=A0A166MNY7_9PEZI|nr:hydroxymethylglutaryl-CoA reductase [Colletotrichum tofieldiae]
MLFAASELRIALAFPSPLDLKGPGIDTTLFAPLATYEPTLVSSYPRGCKVFNASGGLYFEILAPVFIFDDPGDPVAFARALPSLRVHFLEWGESTGLSIYPAVTTAVARSVKIWSLKQLSMLVIDFRAAREEVFHLIILY